MSYFSRYDKGDWNAICDVCGRKYKGSQLRQRWDGLKTCEDDWEPRQPQDFVRGVADYQAPVWTRPEQSDNFISFLYHTALSCITSNTATLIAIKHFGTLTTIIFGLASTVTLVTDLLLNNGAKVLDGSTLNKTTLG